MYIYVVLNVNSLFHKIKQTSEIDIVRQSKPIEFFFKKNYDGILWFRSVVFQIEDVKLPIRTGWMWDSIR